MSSKNEESHVVNRDSSFFTSINVEGCIKPDILSLRWIVYLYVFLINCHYI
jgi:hypothetical protein